MSRPREHHFQSRFIDFQEKDRSRKPCVTIADHSPCEDYESDERVSHKRVTSDVVRTEEALNYGIITRNTNKQVTQRQLAVDKD